MNPAPEESLSDLRRRVDALRHEIAVAEAKVPRMREAIFSRKQTLSRLEARLALLSAPFKAHSRHE